MTIIKLTRRMFAISLIHNPLYLFPQFSFVEKEYIEKYVQSVQYFYD